MILTLTNEQIVQLVHALANFNPKDIPAKTDRRLSRNLRKLVSAQGDYEQERDRIRLSCVVDKSKPPQPGQPVQLNTAEQLDFHPKALVLLKETREVEIHTVEYFDSEAKEIPADKDHAIDRAKVKIPSAILAQLDEIILVECGQVSK